VTAFENVSRALIEGLLEQARASARLTRLFDAE
jgi:hypothetical protein